MHPEVTVDSDKTPRWLVPVFAFLAGVAVTTGILLPMSSSPDYFRGRIEGERIASMEAMDVSNAEMRASFYSGVEAGYHAAKNGEPMPVDKLVK